MATKAWGVDEVAAWLDSIGLARYAPMFRRVGVDGPALYALDDTFLEESLDVPIRLHRRKILREAARVATPSLGTGTGKGKGSLKGKRAGSGRIIMIDTTAPPLPGTPPHNPRISPAAAARAHLTLGSQRKVGRHVSGNRFDRTGKRSGGGRRQTPRGGTEAVTRAALASARGRGEPSDRGGEPFGADDRRGSTGGSSTGGSVGAPVTPVGTTSSGAATDTAGSLLQSSGESKNTSSLAATSASTASLPRAASDWRPHSAPVALVHVDKDELLTRVCQQLNISPNALDDLMLAPVGAWLGTVVRDLGMSAGSVSGRGKEWDDMAALCAQNLLDEGYCTVRDMVADVREPDFRADLQSYGVSKKRFLNEVCQRLQLMATACTGVTGVTGVTQMQYDAAPLGREGPDAWPSSRRGTASSGSPRRSTSTHSQTSAARSSGATVLSDASDASTVMPTVPLQIATGTNAEKGSQDRIRERSESASTSRGYVFDSLSDNSSVSSFSPRNLGQHGAGGGGTGGAGGGDSWIAAVDGTTEASPLGSSLASTVSTQCGSNNEVCLSTASVQEDLVGEDSAVPSPAAISGVRGAFASPLAEQGAQGVQGDAPPPLRPGINITSAQQRMRGRRPPGVATAEQNGPSGGMGGRGGGGGLRGRGRGRGNGLGRGGGKSQRRDANRPAGLALDIAAVDRSTDERASWVFTQSGTLQYEGFKIKQTGIAAAPSVLHPSGEGGGVATTQPVPPRKGGLHLDLVMIRKIGAGGGGVVHKAVHVPSLTVVAVKQIKVFQRAQLKQMASELQALYSFSSMAIAPVAAEGDASATEEEEGAWQSLPARKSLSPYIVNFYDAFTNVEEDTISIVLEYMDAGSLQGLLDTGVALPEKVLANIGFRVLSGLAFLHEHKLLHRDIKPSNLLINHRGDVKIGDFGIARSLDNTEANSNSYLGEYEMEDDVCVCACVVNYCHRVNVQYYRRQHCNHQRLRTYLSSLSFSLTQPTCI